MIQNGFNMGRLLAQCILISTVASLASAQSPPNEPGDFTVSFSFVRIPATGAGLVGDGTMFPGITFPNGAQSGMIFEDFPNKRVRLNFFAQDGITVTSAVFQFFDKQVQYDFRASGNACVRTPLTQTIRPAFDWVSKAAYISSGFGWDLWARTTSPGHLIELAVSTNSTAPPVLLRWQDGASTTEMRLANIISGQPDPSVFNLPAACGN